MKQGAEISKTIAVLALTVIVISGYIFHVDGSTDISLTIAGGIVGYLLAYKNNRGEK